MKSAWQVQPGAEGVQTCDTINIFGTPDIRLTNNPEIPGSTAMMVNMIPHVLNATPGLHTMADLPVPTAMLGDAQVFACQHPREPCVKF